RSRQTQRPLGKSDERHNTLTTDTTDVASTPTTCICCAGGGSDGVPLQTTRGCTFFFHFDDHHPCSTHGGGHDDERAVGRKQRPALRSHNADPMMATYSLSSLQQQGSSVAGGPAGSSLLAGELRRPLHRVNDDDSVQIAPPAEEEDGDENIANEDATTASPAARETQ
ncbi:Hypothetical protein, putative, partial [Bodo saltans]